MFNVNEIILKIFRRLKKIVK